MGGRTLQEMVALTYGADCPVPNANMAAFGFAEPGADTSVPAYAFPEPIANPRFWSLGLDSLKGLKNAPEREIIQLAERVRNEQLDPQSTFYKTFKKSAKIKKWLSQRGATKDQIQTLDLITKLTIIPERPEFPLSEYGLAQTPDGQRIMNAFPLLDQDPLHAQAALGYLLIKYGVSTCVTLSPSFNPVILDLPGGGFLLVLPPLAFDNSHGSHRQTQAFMWFRVLDLVDKMSDLLKEDQFLDTGESLYDRSLFYVATDFGRTKNRNGTQNFGSGHDLNNGSFILCPQGQGRRLRRGSTTRPARPTVSTSPPALPTPVARPSSTSSTPAFSSYSELIPRGYPTSAPSSHSLAPRPTGYQLPVLPIDAQGSFGSWASPFCRSSMLMSSGDRTKAIRPSRGGRLIAIPASINRWHTA